MNNLIRRLKNLWALSDYKLAKPNGFSTLVKEEYTVPVVLEKETKGNGKAEFFGEPTEDDEKEFEREEQGLKGVFGL